jgi:hypothetical protein
MIIDQQCAFIEEQRVSITTEQLERSLDVIVAELNKHNLMINVSAIN